MNLEKNVKSEYEENQENKEKKLNYKYQIFDNKPINTHLEGQENYKISGQILQTNFKK